MIRTGRLLQSEERFDETETDAVAVLEGELFGGRETTAVDERPVARGRFLAHDDVVAGADDPGMAPAQGALGVEITEIYVRGERPGGIRPADDRLAFVDGELFVSGYEERRSRGRDGSLGAGHGLTEAAQRDFGGSQVGCLPFAQAP